MTKKIIIFTIIVFSFVSTKVFSQFTDFVDKNVRYISSTISNTHFKKIWLHDGSAWDLSRHSSFVNLTSVFIVISEERNRAVAFIHGQDYNVSHAGGQFYYNRGSLQLIINKYEDGSRIMLEDRTEWDIVGEEGQKHIANLFIPTHVVFKINSESFIEPRSQKIINAKLVED